MNGRIHGVEAQGLQYRLRRLWPLPSDRVQFRVIGIQSLPCSSKSDTEHGPSQKNSRQLAAVALISRRPSLRSTEPASLQAVARGREAALTDLFAVGTALVVLVAVGRMGRHGADRRAPGVGHGRRRCRGLHLVTVTEEPHLEIGTI